MSFRARLYNKRTSKQLGWEPHWFIPGHKKFDQKLIDAVKRFQRDKGIKVDGFVGPTTFRRIRSEVELKQEENRILVNGKFFKVDFPVRYDPINPKTKRRTYKKVRKTRQPKMIVTHWDVTTSAKKCKNVLEWAGLSTHFCIDNDGTIYQFVDTNHIAYHAGGVNKVSIGIDLSNAYYLKYNDIYEKRGFGARPVLTSSRVHGKTLDPHLGFYPKQIEAYKKLVSFLHEVYGIPLRVPLTERGDLDTGVVKSVKKRRFSGIVNHYHITRNKIDCAGLRLREIVNSIN